jgi:tetratricopeptide (TPR) repeat protein
MADDKPIRPTAKPPGPGALADIGSPAAKGGLADTAATADSPAEAPLKTSFLSALADKWQLPLLALGLLLLLTGLPRLFNKKIPVNVDEQLTQARLALQRNQPIQAIVRIEALLNEPASDAQRGTMVLIRGLANFEQAGTSRDATQRAFARQTIADMDKAVSLAGSIESLDRGLIGPVEFYLKRGQARQWSLDNGDADLIEVLSRAEPGQEPLSRRALELLWDGNPDVVRKHLDGMLARTDLSSDDRLWAISRKSRLLVRQGKLADAEQMLDGYLEKLPSGSSQDVLEIELARLHYDACMLAGPKMAAGERDRRLNKAFLLLSAVQLRRRPDAAEPQVDAELHWLLGEVNLLQDRPAEAEKAYERVAHAYADTRFGRAARLGVAKSAALYKPIDRAYEAYRQVVDELLHEPDDPMVDRRAVQNSLLTLAEQLRKQERWEPSYQFLELLYPMLDSTQANPSQTEIRHREGQMLRRLAIEEKQSAERLVAREAAVALAALGRPPASQPDDVVRLTGQARRHLQMAAEAFLDTARLCAADDDMSGDNLELAANCYDEAGDVYGAIVVLRKFVHDYPTAQSRVARAVFNLAKAYQAAGCYDEAIAQYRQMTSEYRNSPNANKSQVPMAQCYKALGKLDEAEKVLSGILADDQHYSPESTEYRQSLFELAKLFYERRQYREAVARFDEALQREPDAREAIYCRYFLADSYRLSGLELDSAIRSARTPLERGQWTAARTAWLGESRDQFDRVVAALETRAATGGPGNAGSLSELDLLYLRNSYFFRADCLFDLGRFSEALDLYEVAALKYANQPEAIAAHVQIVNCYVKLNQLEQARAVNERAKWLLKKLPVDSFSRRALPMDKDYLSKWLNSAGGPASFQVATPTPGGAP